MPKPHRPLLVTHSGTFHLDDAFAYAVLRLALGLDEPGHDHALVRTRDGAAIAEADVVWDVGAVYDAAANRFDHHQRGAPVREDGLPYSAAGLVWRHHGEAAARALLAPSCADHLAAAVAAEMDRKVVRRIDAIDNGVGPPGDALGLASLVEDLNPPWDSPGYRRSGRRGRDVPAGGRPRGGLPAPPHRGRAGAPRRRCRGPGRAHPLGRPARARTRPQAALGGAGASAWAPRALRRLPGAQRQLDGGRDAAGAGLLRSAPPTAEGVGRAARRGPRRGLRRAGRGVRARAPLRGPPARARGRWRWPGRRSRSGWARARHPASERRTDRTPRRATRTPPRARPASRRRPGRCVRRAAAPSARPCDASRRWPPPRAWPSAARWSA